MLERLKGAYKEGTNALRFFRGAKGTSAAQFIDPYDMSLPAVIGSQAWWDDDAAGLNTAVTTVEEEAPLMIHDTSAAAEAIPVPVHVPVAAPRAAALPSLSNVTTAASHWAPVVATALAPTPAPSRPELPLAMVIAAADDDHGLFGRIPTPALALAPTPMPTPAAATEPAATVDPRASLMTMLAQRSGISEAPVVPAVSETISSSLALVPEPEDDNNGLFSKPTRNTSLGVGELFGRTPGGSDLFGDLDAAVETRRKSTVPAAAVVVAPPVVVRSQPSAPKAPAISSLFGKGGLFGDVDDDAAAGSLFGNAPSVPVSAVAAKALSQPVAALAVTSLSALLGRGGSLFADDDEEEAPKALLAPPVVVGPAAAAAATAAATPFFTVPPPSAPPAPPPSAPAPPPPSVSPSASASTAPPPPPPASNAMVRASKPAYKREDSVEWDAYDDDDDDVGASRNKPSVLARFAPSSAPASAPAPSPDITLPAILPRPASGNFGFALPGLSNSGGGVVAAIAAARARAASTEVPRVEAAMMDDAQRGSPVQPSGAVLLPLKAIAAPPPPVVAEDDEYLSMPPPLPSGGDDDGTTNPPPFPQDDTHKGGRHEAPPPPPPPMFAMTEGSTSANANAIAGLFG